MRFDNLTKTEFVVVLAGLRGQHGVAMNGFQILPEPANLVLLATGGRALLLRRR